MIAIVAEGGTKMRKYYTRQQVVQARIQKDEYQQAVMIWLPVGFAFFELMLHIFPKITYPV
jgi:hypothetical protein